MLRAIAPLLLLISWLWASPALADARYYVVIRGVDEAAGVKSEVVPELRKLFTAELKKHPEFTLEAPAGLPEDPEAMVNELKNRKLKAFEVTLKVLEVTRDLKPAPPGKQYRVLARGIKLSVFGSTMPEKIVAIGGDGESSVGAEVGKQADLDKEGRHLLLDCAANAIKQAVDMTVTKLNLAGKPAPKLGGKPKKKTSVN